MLGLFVVSVVSVAPVAMAVEPVLTFTFSDLNGSFDSSSMLFEAVNRGDMTLGATHGDVTRLDGLNADAFFDGTGDPYTFFELKMTVSSPIPPLDADTIVDGVGTIKMVDVDGDILMGDVSGVWINNGAANFVGSITNFTITSDEGVFDGTDGSATSLVGLDGPYDGNVVTLAFGEWFTDGNDAFESFDDVTVLSQGAVVPEPVSLSLLGFGALAVFARRRR